MNLPRLLAFALLLVGLALGGTWLLHDTHAPLEAPIAIGPGSRASAGLEPPAAELAVAEQLAGTEERAPARSNVSSSSLARTLDVRVSIPAGAPADPTLALLAVPATARDGAAPHTYLERVRAGGTAPVTARASVAPDGTARLELPAGVGATELLLDGRFLYTEEALPIAESASALSLEARLGACLVVELTRADGATPRGAIALSGGDFSGRRRGGFERREQPASETLVFRGLDATRTWTLTPELEDGYADVHWGIELEPGQELGYEMPVLEGATLSGEVVDGSGAGIAGVRVGTADGSPWFGGADEQETTTDANGRFLLSGIGPGERKIEAALEGWRTTTVEGLELADGEQRESMRLVLDRGAAIGGVVRWQDGQPAESAKVVVDALRRRQGWGNWGGPRRRNLGEATTDSRGAFRVSGLDEGSYSVAATLAATPDQPGESRESGEQDANGDDVLWRAAESAVATGRSDLVLTLVGPIAFAGRVVDDLGAPVSAFEIEADSAEDGGPSERARFEDDEGRFSFARVGPGEWSVTATAPGHVQRQPVPVTLPGGGGELELRLERTASVSGRVVDATGAPARGAAVRVDDGQQRRGPWGGARGPRTETDEEGRFALEELAPGSISLIATAENWADSEPLAVELAPGQAFDDALVALRVGGRIEGVVVTPEGDPRPGRRVTWGSNAMGFGSRGDTRTDGQGRFVFDHVTPGEWAVSAAPSMSEMSERMRGRRDQGAFVEVMGELVTETVSVTDGEVVEVFLGGEPRRPVRVQGVVSMAGDPVPGARVFAVSEGSAVFEGMKTAEAAEDGSFEIVVDRPGPYVVSATFERVGVETFVDVPRADETYVELFIPLGRIEGKVEKPDGRAATGVRLNLQREDGLGRLRWGGDQATSDDEGRYAFEGLEAGTYTVRANVATWSGAADRTFGTSVRDGVSVDDDGPTSGIDFKLEMAGSVEGTVLGPDDAPLARASIFFRDAQGRLVSRVSGTESDANGKFRRDGLAPGEYSLSARADGFAASDATSVRIGSETTAQVRLVVETGTMLLVQIEEDDGELQRARVEVTDGEGRQVGDLWTVRQIQAAFNEGGSSLEQKLGPVPPGRYTVKATLRDGRLVEKRVWIRGREAEKSVRLKIKS